jgi:transcriptional regulator with XRE-family HTH domain
MRPVLSIAYYTPNRTPTCEPIYERVGCNIKAWREHLGFTQRELAEAVGITRTSINNTEAGRQRLMLHTIEQVALALGIPFCDLFAGWPTCLRERKAEGTDE